MIKTSIWCNWVSCGSMVMVVAGVVVGLSSCAGEPVKPTQTVSPDQVHGHADKAFDKLKQEEKSRVLPSGSPY